MLRILYGSHLWSNLFQFLRNNATHKFKVHKKKKTLTQTMPIKVGSAIK